MKKRVWIVSFVAMMSLTAFGCAGGGREETGVAESVQASTTAPEPVEGGDGRVVASATTRAGSRVRFVAGDGNELGVAILSRAGFVDPVLEAAKHAKRTGGAVAFYEALTGERAPSALVAAVTAASVPGAADASDDGEEELEAPNVTAADDAPLPPDFCDVEPDSMYGKQPFVVCWPNQRGTTYLKRKNDAMTCRVDAVEGPLSFRYRYKTASGWHTPYSVIGQAGWDLEYETYYQWARRWRDCHVFKNDGEKLHHFRAGGFKYLKPLGFMPFEVHFP